MSTCHHQLFWFILHYLSFDNAIERRALMIQLKLNQCNAFSVAYFIVAIYISYKKIR